MSKKREEFEDLAEKAKLLNVQNPKTKLSMNLSQIQRDSQNFATKAGGNAADTKAQMLLAKSGFDIGKTREKLTEIEVLNPVQISEFLEPVDVESFLKREHQNLILTAIEESQKQTMDDFHDILTKSMEGDWNRVKKMIFDRLAHHSSLDVAQGKMERNAEMETDYQPTSSNTSQNFSSSKVAVGVNPIDNALAKIIVELNKNRLQRETFSLATKFALAVVESGNRFEDRSFRGDMGAINDLLLESWMLVGSLVGELKDTDEHFAGRTFDLTKPSSVKEGNYLDVYEKSNEDIRNFIIERSRNYLEKQYIKVIEKKIQVQQMQARLGGNSDFVERIISYLNTKEPGKGLQTEEHIWAVIYYLLRCGMKDKAIKLCQTRYKTYFDQNDKEFTGYLMNFENKPDQEMRSKIQAYSRRSTNKYRQAVYKIVGRLDLSKKNIPEIIESTEDYIWLQLMLIRESSSDVSQESYTLSDLQKKMNDLGPSYFDPNKTNPLKYFQVLLFVGQFEKAIEHLHSYPDYQTQALHFAITLSYYGLLDLNKEFDAEKRSKLNFPGMIYRYINSFWHNEPETALQYILLVNCGRINVKNRSASLQKHVQAYLKELILKSRDFSILNNITSWNPLINPQGADDFAKNVAKEVAYESENSGQIEDALNLYNMTDLHENSLRLVVRILGDDLIGDKYMMLAKKTLDYLKSSPSRSQVASLFVTSDILLQMRDFFAKYKNNQIELSLDSIRATKVFPIGGEKVEDCVRKFDGLDDSIKKNIPLLLTTTMEALYKFYSKNHLNANNTLIKSEAKNLILYAGQLKYHMPADTYPSLVQKEIRMI